jgi:hypothetical protein
MHSLSLFPLSFFLITEDHCSLSVGEEPDNNWNFAISRLTYWMKSAYDKVEERVEEQEQYSRRTNLRFNNVRVPTNSNGNIIQPIDTDSIVLKICKNPTTEQLYHLVLLNRVVDQSWMQVY